MSLWATGAQSHGAALDCTEHTATQCSWGFIHGFLQPWRLELWPLWAALHKGLSTTAPEKTLRLRSRAMKVLESAGSESPPAPADGLQGTRGWRRGTHSLHTSYFKTPACSGLPLPQLLALISMYLWVSMSLCCPSVTKVVHLTCPGEKLGQDAALIGQVSYASLLIRHWPRKPAAPASFLRSKE